MMNNYLENRNITIDLLRALTMALMLMVNDFWSVPDIPHWMEHAAWGEDMLGFSDIVFPTFLFCVGLSIPYAITAMKRKGKSDGDVIRHILFRSFALILMGSFICNYEEGIDPAIGYNRSVYSLLMAAAFFLTFNQYRSQGGWVRILKIAGWAILLFLLITSRSPKGNTFYPYWWGILGLIGWAYLFCAIVYALAQKKYTLIIVWLVLFTVCLCCSETADSSYFQGGRILHFEGKNIVDLTLSTLHIGNASNHLLVMSGVLLSACFLSFTSSMSLRKKTIFILVLAFLCFAFGVASHQLFIISKLIGTLPWIFYTLGIDLLLYIAFDWLVAANRQDLLKVLKPAGVATLTCYMIPYIIYPIISETIGWEWSSSIPAPFGLIKCICFSGVCIGITWLLTKVSIKLKI